MESKSLSVEQGGREMTEKRSQDLYTSTGRSNSSWNHANEEQPRASAEEEILQHLETRITEENKEGLDVSLGGSVSLWEESKEHHRSRQHEDHIIAPEGKRRKKVGKKIVVGMKLTAECREVLTWTIAKLAHPGDHVVALHVSSFHSQSGIEDSGAEQQLASSLRAVLSVYEGLCNIKHIKLQLEIVNANKVRKHLVAAAHSYDAYKLILGSHKRHAIGWSASLGKYCLKRLPSTCTVMILEHGKIIFDRKGTQMGTPGSSMMKVLRRSVRSIGRSRKVSVACLDDDRTDDAQSTISSPTTETKEISGDCDQNSDFDSNFSSSTVLHEDLSDSPISVLPLSRNDSILSFDAFRLSYSKRRMEGSISKRTSSLRVGLDCEKSTNSLSIRNLNEEDSVKSEELDPYPTETCNSDNESLKSAVSEEVATSCFSPTRNAQKGWPLMHRSISLDKKSSGQTLDRSLSVVNWAMQLPHRRWVEPGVITRTPIARLVDEFPERVFLSHEFRKEEVSHRQTQTGACSGNFFTAEVRLSFSLPHVRSTQMKEYYKPNGLLSLTRQIDRLCLDRPCVYTYEELEAATSRFSPSKLVGIGGGSQVFRGETQDGKLLAVKVLNQGSPQAEEELLTDIEINSSLKHRNIVALLGYCADSKHLILVYDFLPRGNLDDHLHGGKDAPVLPWDVRYKVAVGIARVLDYLHDGCPRPVIHRDVKASNILLSASFEPQLSDFGLAKWAPTNVPFIRCNDVVGTFGYLAPEYFMYGRVNDKTDVYSYGVVLLELITGRQPIDTTRPKGQENLVLWARSLLTEKRMETLVDPLLKGIFDTKQMESMMLAAALCIRHSAQRRPRMNRVIKVLSEEGGSIGYRPRQELPKSLDMEESSNCYNLEGAANYGDTDIQTHLALAMMGVDDDDAFSQDQSGALAHSSKYLEEYLAGRYSRSASFNEYRCGSVAPGDIRAQSDGF